jgi:hypothetical protein
MRTAYKILVRKPEWKRPSGRSRRRWEENIEIDLGQLVWEYMVWVHLPQDMNQWWVIVCSVMNLRVP